MLTCESLLARPIEWVARQLECLPATPLRRAVVLVPCERHAHAIRRHVCVERRAPGLLAGVLLLRPLDFAREVLLRAGAVHTTGWEEIRRLRILQLFESRTLAGDLRYFDTEQLRSGQGYVDAVARTIGDLETSGLDPQLTLKVAADLSHDDQCASDRLHDVVLIWQAADRDLGALLSAPQLFAAATGVVATRPEVVTPFGTLTALLTASPSSVLLRFLRVLPACHAALHDARPARSGTQRWRSVIGLHGPAPAPPPPAPVARELGLVQRLLFETPERLTDPQRQRSAGLDGSVDVEEYSSIEEEIEAAVGWMTEQIAAGVPAEQIAILVPDVDAYAPRLVDRVRRVTGDAGAGGAAVYVAAGLRLAESPAGRRLQTLFTALARGLEATATIRLLPALRRGETDNASTPPRLSPSRAAALVYGAGIVGGAPGDTNGVSEWVSRLTHRRDVLRAFVAAATAAASDLDEPEKRRHVVDRQQAERWLRDIDPMLPAIAALQSVAIRIRDAAPLAVVWDLVQEFAARWLRLPPDPPNLFALLAPRLQPILADRAASAVTGVSAVEYLKDLIHREGRPTARFGEPYVFVGTPAQAAGLPFVAVRILGLAEGGVPRTPHDDPIVPDELRARIESAAQSVRPDVIVPRLADQVLEDIHDVGRVISGVTRCVALSAPRQWLDRSEREVSGILLEVATALGRPPVEAADDGDVPTAARLRAVYLDPGRAARLRYAHLHPLSPKTILASVPQRTARHVAVPSAWMQEPLRAVDRIHALAAAAGAAAWCAPDGSVAEAWGLVQPPGLSPQRPISASALAILLSCPHRFLLERILHLNEPMARPSTDVIDPIAYGSMFHAAADRLFREIGPAVCRHEGNLDQWLARARQIATAQFEALGHEYPLRGADSIARERQRLLTQIEQLVRYEWQQPAREFLASELSFGDPDAVCLPFEDGELYVWGAIDRVDRVAGGLSVRDLKTGRVYDRQEQPINAARDLQVGLYSLALEASGYGGAPVSDAAYVHPSVAQLPDRAFAGADMEVLRRRTREWLRVAHALLHNGAFPRTPVAEDCRYCPLTPACGENAQQRSARKLAALPATHALQLFVRFKHEASSDEG